MSRRPHQLLGLVVPIVAFCAAVPVLTSIYQQPPVTGWLLSIGASIWSLVAIAAVTGARLLTDEHNRWSLSRLQLVAWTVLVLSTFWAMSLTRLFGHAVDPLALNVDNNLWLLLGISGTSSVASPLILARKQTAAQGIVDRPRSVGVDSGSLRDLFRGEDVGNANVVDIGRVQMAFFTFVCLCTYFLACWRALATQAHDAVVFPPVSSDLVALLGISHATYLANKNIDRPATGV
jgi:hypothetical protein